jgi:diguanylate cyclase (GGDEF)-like protein/PAS domain S-box-containing protein
LLSLSADWIWEQDADLVFTYVSAGLELLTGVAPAFFIGQKRLVRPSPHVLDEDLQAYESAIAARRAFRDFTYGFRHSDGRLLYIRISGEPVFDEAGAFNGYRGVGRDVTAMEEASSRLVELARQDALTGLPNRSQFMLELGRAISRCQRQGGNFAVCFIDLDRFKVVNDTLGHASGDALLQEMARRLSEAVRENDVVARLGGDEFVVLIEGHVDVSTVSAVALKLLATLAAPVRLQESDFELGASIGVAVYPQDGASAELLLKNADTAMYEAKDAGRNDWRFYAPAMADAARRAFELESALRLGLVRSELVLHYQPKVDAMSARIVGLEALVRWQRPGFGLVPPGDFIPLAEERGLIVPLGRWVLEEACRQMASWLAQGVPVVPVAVNLSARQFNGGTLLEDVRQALLRHHLAPALLELELTESTLMTDPQRGSETLCRLSELGVGLAIDDFGTGYSSLAYLKRFSAQTVKIDRSFVRSLPQDDSDRAIVTAVITLAHGLGLDVVAEGVETTAQLDFLRRVGCDEIQGFLFGRPVAAQETELLLAEGVIEINHPRLAAG